MALTAWWNPGWYNTDQPLKVGRRDRFGFRWPEDEPKRGYDLTFTNSGGLDWDYRWATVVSVEHAEFGPVHEVDTTRFGQYTFRFADGRWVTIETEEGPGTVNAASPDFPVDACPVEWADNAGWALVVTLADVDKADPPTPPSASDLLKAVTGSSALLDGGAGR